MKYGLWSSATLILLNCLTAAVPSAVAREHEWSFSFQAGSANPAGDFNTFVEDDMVYGLSLGYSQHSFLGFQLAYANREFEICSPTNAPEDLRINTVALYGTLSHDFPRWIRIYGLFGPTYFSSNGQEWIRLGSDGEDISFSGGIGFIFKPIPRWGLQFQSIYYLSEIGNKAFRTEWFETTIGLHFTF
ncbi:outer membrane beta-barrel protein [bacterium]|nr:outer membrane beta-barrel protein [candidate division CSSED10-310 bacterium]